VCRDLSHGGSAIGYLFLRNLHATNRKWDDAKELAKMEDILLHGALAHRVGRLRKTSQLLSRCLSESCGAAWRAHDNVMIERSMSGMQQSASHSESRVEQ